MTEIKDKHCEWATVDRMRTMIESVHGEYEVTQTFALFTGIMCWTIQRIRSDVDGTDTTKRIRDLHSKLESEGVHDLLQRLGLNTKQNNANILNLSKYSSSLSALIALRDAVAHGDARSVVPLNDGGRLIGYRLECRSPRGTHPSWKKDVSLSCLAMSRIAGDLAKRYCDAVISPDDHSGISEAQGLQEVREGLINQFGGGELLA